MNVQDSIHVIDSMVWPYDGTNRKHSVLMFPMCLRMKKRKDVDIKYFSTTAGKQTTQFRTQFILSNSLKVSSK